MASFTFAMSNVLMDPVRSMTNTTSSGEDDCPQNPRHAAARTAPVLPWSNPMNGANQ